MLFNLRAVVFNSGWLGGMFLTQQKIEWTCVLSFFCPKILRYFGSKFAIYGLGPHLDSTQELPGSIWKQNFPTLQAAQHWEAWNAWVAIGSMGCPMCIRNVCEHGVGRFMVRGPHSFSLPLLEGWNPFKDSTALLGNFASKTLDWSFLLWQSLFELLLFGPKWKTIMKIDFLMNLSVPC